jgi:hypothetical protein
MTVKDLIDGLKQFPADLQVVYPKYSEHCILDAADLIVDEFCIPRPDGWVQNKRNDMPSQQYLILAGD